MFNYTQLDMVGRLGYAFAWAVTFLIMSVMLAGAGHGFFGTLEIFSAPFSLAGTEWAWYGCLPMALSLAALAPSKLFPIFAVIHYLSVATTALFLDRLEWERLEELPPQFLILSGVTLVLYAAGHYFLWQIWLARRLTRSHQKTPSSIQKLQAFPLEDKKDAQDRG